MDYVTALEIVTHVADLYCLSQTTGLVMGPPAPYTRDEVRQAVAFLKPPRVLPKPGHATEYVPQHAA